MTRHRVEHYIMIKEGDIAVLNMHTPNNRVAKYVKLKLIELKGELDRSIIKVGDFKTLSQQIIELDRKIRKDTEELNNIGSNLYF